MSVEPSLTIVLLMSRSYAWLRPTIRAWGRQTIHDQIEAVLIRPASLTGEAISSRDLEPFHSHRIHDVPFLDTTATGFAAGVQEARAPVVMLAEDHAFPDAHLAESILQIFPTDPDVVAVGPVVVNGNPQTAASEASFVVAFSGSAYVRTTHEARSLAGHNGSYRRAFLLQYGDGLAEMYKSERLLQYDIEARGKKMILLAETRMQHWNSSRWGSVLAHAYSGGRLFAGQRARTWGKTRRLAYILGAPLIPLVRMRRILQDLRESPADYARIVPRRLPLVALPLFVHAFGEATGYLFGLGDVEAHYAPFELLRRDQLLPEDQQAIDRRGIDAPSG